MLHLHHHDRCVAVVGVYRDGRGRGGEEVMHFALALRFQLPSGNPDLHRNHHTRVQKRPLVVIVIVMGVASRTLLDTNEAASYVVQLLHDKFGR